MRGCLGSCAAGTTCSAGDIRRSLSLRKLLLASITPTAIKFSVMVVLRSLLTYRSPLWIDSIVLFEVLSHANVWRVFDGRPGLTLAKGWAALQHGANFPRFG